MIKYNNSNINDWNFGDDNIAKVYYGVTSALPYDAEIEYLQSSGTQYINTNIYLNPSNFEVGYNILGNSVKWGYTHQGSGAGTWITVESSTAFFGNYNNGRVTITTDSTENVIKYVSTSGITVNGTSYSKTFEIGSDSIASIPLYLFVMYDFRNGMDYSSSAKVKSFYVKNDGELVLDMIPVRVGQVGYMYDRVSGQLFGNDGTGDFILGADKYTPSSMSGRLPSGYTEVEYIRHSNDVKVKNVWSVPNDAVEGNIYTVDLLLDSASQQNVSRYIGLFGWGSGYCQRTNRAAGDETNIGYRHSDGWYGDSTIGNYYQEYDVKLRYRMTPTSLAITNTQTSGVTTINLPYKDSGSGTGGNFGVFSYTGSDTGSYQMRGNIYQIIIEGSDNTIKHQYIPCQRDSDSKYGLYDLVGQEFYYPTTITISGGSAVTPSSMSGRLVYQKITNGSTPPTPPIDYANEYLTFVAQTDGVTIGLNNARSNVFQYSLDSGNTWNNLVNKQSTPSINNGDKIMFKASGLSVDGEKGIGRLHPSASASVEGNVMSLIYGDDFSGQTAIPNNFQFRRLFSGATNLTSAENFVIPATSLRKQCYSGMFQACTSLTKTPKAIGSSAMTWNGGDYVMSDMFHGCTSLTTVSSGLLPALNLGNQCYWYMFEDCSSLTETPHLLATEAATQCYQGMFKNCSSLNNVTCLLRNPSTYSEWLDGVAANGTFYKNSNASWSSGSNGIPTNWTVVDYTT